MEKFPSDFWPRLELLRKPIGELRYRRVTYPQKFLGVAASDLDVLAKGVGAVMVIRDDVDVRPQSRLQLVLQV